ncbi:hypothetical protein [Taibaiella chishuiensis]|uniref:Uncharacterized protein n=1 Tax=Taibaiella chishuiensis TaxID=1434707 RepID=A0A2P8CWL2_9BACT|nr:hypothetical protein [Taibaiella chishuiensis]PSK89326.1 hypothetical protein B0I18_112127 [Taibaiella chishuiensis]
MIRQRTGNNKRSINLQLLSTIVLAILLTGFKGKKEIGSCYTSFQTASALTAGDPERLPEGAEKVRTLKTEQGEVAITRIDGYRILYNNEKNRPFVNLKVELSEEQSYDKDQKHLLDNLKYLNAHTQNRETRGLVELEFNGYKIYGISRAGVEMGSTLGTFVMFPGNGVTVYFYFNNMKPEFRNFKSVDDYKKQRNRFMNEYTKYLAQCKGK